MQTLTMNKWKINRILCALILSVGLMISCGDETGTNFNENNTGNELNNSTVNNSDPQENNSNNTDNNHDELAEPVVVNGMLQTEEAAEIDIEGSLITAYGFESEGELSIISSGNVTLSAQGAYELVVESANLVASEIVLIVENEGDRLGAVLVDLRGEAEGQITAAPINAETTVEADAYAAAQANGEWDDTCSASELRAMISYELAAEIYAQAQSEYDATITSLASGLTAAMQASYELMVEYESYAAGEIDALIDAKAQLRAQLDAELHAQAQTAEGSVSDNVETYLEATADIYADAGITVEEQARCTQASIEAMLVYTAELSGSIRQRAEGEAEHHRARLVNAAVQAQFEAMGYVESTSEYETVVQAGIDLMADIEASMEGEGSIESAWENYRLEVEGALGVMEVTVYESLSTSSELDAAISNAITVVAELDIDSSAQINGEAVASAIAELHASILAEGSAHAAGVMDDMEAEVQALLEVFFHLSLCA